MGSRGSFGGGGSGAPTQAQILAILAGLDEPALFGGDLFRLGTNGLAAFGYDSNGSGYGYVGAFEDASQTVGARFDIYGLEINFQTGPTGQDFATLQLGEDGSAVFQGAVYMRGVDGLSVGVGTAGAAVQDSRHIGEGIFQTEVYDFDSGQYRPWQQSARTYQFNVGIDGDVLSLTLNDDGSATFGGAITMPGILRLQSASGASDVEIFGEVDGAKYGYGYYYTGAANPAAPTPELYLAAFGSEVNYADDGTVTEAVSAWQDYNSGFYLWRLDHASGRMWLGNAADDGVNMLQVPGPTKVTGAIITAAHAAPADADLATGDMAIWFDQTPGSAALRIKAKQADGSVKTGTLAVTT